MASPDEPLDAVINAFLDHLDGGGPAPSIEHLGPGDRARAEALIASLKAGRGMDPYTTPPPIEQLLAAALRQKATSPAVPRTRPRCPGRRPRRSSAESSARLHSTDGRVLAGRKSGPLRRARKGAAAPAVPLREADLGGQESRQRPAGRGGRGACATLSSAVAVRFVPVAQGWLRGLVVVPPAAADVMDRDENREHIVRVVAIALALRWAAYVDARRRDAAIRLGMWLGLAGVGTSVRGLLGMRLGVPSAKVEVGLGVAVSVLGYYLGATREHLKEDEGATERANRRARRHRMMLAAALIALPVLAEWTSVRFHAPGRARPAVTIADRGMAGGAVLATAGCLILFFVITVLHSRPVPDAEEAQERRNRLRVRLIRASTIAGGMACLAYAAAHVASSTFAPTVQLRVVLPVTAGLLCLASRECFRPASAHVRPVLVWSEARRREGRSGVAAAEATVRIRRAWAGRDPLCRPGLAASLHLLAVRLGELGQRVEALEHAEEAVRIRRSLVETDPAYLDVLASSLHLLSVRLRELGRREDALALAEEADRIRSTSTDADPVTRTDLAASRHLCHVLRRELERTRPHPVQEAVTTLRLLAASAA